MGARELTLAAGRLVDVPLLEVAAGRSRRAWRRVEHALDLRILAATVRTLAARRGV